MMTFRITGPADVQTIRATDPDAVVDAVLSDREAGRLGDRVIWDGARVVAIVHPAPDGGRPRVTQP